jgi:hypothetical protein
MMARDENSKVYKPRASRHLNKLALIRRLSELTCLMSNHTSQYLAATLDRARL